jgi:hypothetical protein
MKTRRNILLAMTYMVGFTTLTYPPGGNSSSHTGIHEIIPTIKMMVIGGPKLKPNEGGSTNCNININAKGCIEVDRGDTAEVTFEFDGFPKWHFTEFKICKGTKADKLAGTWDCNLSELQREDFKFTDGSGTELHPDENGVVKLNDFSGSLRKFKLHDENRVPQEYFYQVKACKPLNSIATCGVSDPPIRNR